MEIHDENVKRIVINNFHVNCHFRVESTGTVSDWKVIAEATMQSEQMRIAKHPGKLWVDEPLTPPRKTRVESLTAFGCLHFSPNLPISSSNDVLYEQSKCLFSLSERLSSQQAIQPLRGNYFWLL